MKNKDVTWQTGIRNAIPEEWNRLVHISLMEKEIIIFPYADNVLHKELLSFSHEPSDLRFQESFEGLFPIPYILCQSLRILPCRLL